MVMETQVFVCQCKQSAHSSSEYQEKTKEHNYHRHYKSKWDHRRRKHVHGNKMHNGEVKSVTQKINVERNGFKCMINLDTTMSDDKKNEQARNCVKANLKNSNVERIVPHCLRHSCHRHIHHETLRHAKQQKTGLICQEKNLNGATKCMDQSKRKCRHSRHGILRSKEKFCQKQNVSKLGAYPKINSYYEDISTTSINKYLEIPISYKHVLKRNDGVYESKLDSLIKRTKERERKLVEQSRRTTRWYTSTPTHTDASLSDFPLSCSEIASLHSRSTLILEPKDHGYSRSIYSPNNIEFPRIYTEIKYIEEDILKYLNIKDEPPMDIEVYSPTNNLVTIKNEIKIEPKV